MATDGLDRETSEAPIVATRPRRHDSPSTAREKSKSRIRGGTLRRFVASRVRGVRGVIMSIGSSVRKLETNAYGAILKAMAVTGLTWDREEFLGRLRVELNISAEEHMRFREQMDADENVNRMRSSYVEYKEGQEAKRQRVEAPRPAPVARAAKPQRSANVRAPKISAAALAQMGVNEYICKRVKRFWPSEGGWFDCIITDYNPETKLHCLTYDINTPNESFEWADISSFSEREFKIQEGKVDISQLQAMSAGAAMASSPPPVVSLGTPAASIVQAATKAKDPQKLNAMKETLTAEEEALKRQLAALDDSDDDSDDDDDDA